jgi:hypothetical protein
MTLAAVIPLDCIRVGFAHDQFLRWDHRGIHLPMIGTVERDIPWGQAIDQFLQGCRITTPTLPVKEVACITIKSLPDPEFAPFFLRKCHISSSSETQEDEENTRERIETQVGWHDQPLHSGGQWADYTVFGADLN